MIAVGAAPASFASNWPTSSATAARVSPAREWALAARAVPSEPGVSGVWACVGFVRMARGSGEGVTDSGECADDLGHDGVIGILLGADLLQVHARPQEDPR